MSRSEFRASRLLCRNFTERREREKNLCSHMLASERLQQSNIAWSLIIDGSAAQTRESNSQKRVLSGYGCVRCERHACDEKFSSTDSWRNKRIEPEAFSISYNLKRGEGSQQHHRIWIGRRARLNTLIPTKSDIGKYWLNKVVWWKSLSRLLGCFRLHFPYDLIWTL